MRKARGRVFDFEHELALRATLAHERDAALHGESEPQLGLDVAANAIEGIDECERELDRTTGIIFARDRQADDDPQHRLVAGGGRGSRRLRGTEVDDRDILAVDRKARDIEQRVVLERDITRDLVEIVDQPRRARGPELALECSHAAQHAFEDVDVLALALVARLVPRRGRRPGTTADRSRWAGPQDGDRVPGHDRARPGRCRRQIDDGDRSGDRVEALVSPGRLLGAHAMRCTFRGRPRRRRALRRRYELRELLGQRARIEQGVGLVAPLELKPTEVVLEISRGLVAVVAMKRERLEDHALEGVRQLGREVLGPWNRARLHHLERFFTFAVEQRPCADQLVQHDARRKHIGAAVDRLATRLLGRHVRELALDDALFLVDVTGARDPEVDDLHAAVKRQQDILRRDISMHDAKRLTELVGLAMRVVEALGELLNDVSRDPVGQAEADLRCLLQHAQEVDSLDVLHREEVGVADGTEVEHLDDVRVVEAERDLRLVDEHRDELTAARVCGVDLLDDEGLVETLRHDRAREIHLGHPTCADLSDQRVFAELLHRLSLPPGKSTDCSGNSVDAQPAGAQSLPR